MNRIPWSLTVLIATAVAFAQVQAPAEFETATVRPNTLDDHIVTVNVGPAGRFDARGYTLVLLMQRAYGVMDWNVSGGPAWIRTDRFDVAAKASVAGNLTEAQLQPMLQRLLAERFKLKLHKSSKEVPGYALVAGKDGPKVKLSADGVEHPDTFRMSRTGLSGKGITMENLARWVAGKLGLVAVDQTGLKGPYDVKADWKVDEASDELQASVFAALRNQLGLELAAKKITIEMLVIDNAEKPSTSAN
jgi:uncharacterized protein (TIGR03435 family)